MFWRQRQPPPKLILQDIDPKAKVSQVSLEMIENFFEECKKPRKPKRSWWSNDDNDSKPWWEGDDDDQQPEEPGPVIAIISAVNSAPEVDMKKVEELIREITLDSVEWKASEVIDYIYGLKKLRIAVELDTTKTTKEELEDKLTKLDDDFIASADIVEWDRIEMVSP
eukprot:gene10155-2575_t